MQKQWAVGGKVWNGVEIAGVGLPIVFLHGWGRSSDEWIPFGDELHKKTGRTVFCLDLPGFGGSVLPRVDSVEQYSELLVAWMDYLEINKIDLIGHSLGGRVGIGLGAQQRGRIGRLILIDAAGVRVWSAKREIIKTVAKLFGWMPAGLRRKLVTGLMDEDYRNSPALRELYRAVVKTDLQPYLSKIECPTTVIWGEQDPLLPLALTKIYRRLIPRVAIRVVWEAGHDPQLTHPRELQRILEEVWI